jgi:hypothetical protein
MVRVITNNKLLIDKLDIKYTEDVSMDDNWIYVYVHHFNSDEPTVVKVDKNATDINKVVLNKLIYDDRVKKVNSINTKIQSKKNIFKKIFRL